MKNMQLISFVLFTLIVSKFVTSKNFISMSKSELKLSQAQSADTKTSEKKTPKLIAPVSIEESNLMNFYNNIQNYTFNNLVSISNKVFTYNKEIVYDQNKSNWILTSTFNPKVNSPTRLPDFDTIIKSDCTLAKLKINLDLSYIKEIFVSGNPDVFYFLVIAKIDGKIIGQCQKFKWFSRLRSNQPVDNYPQDNMNCSFSSFNVKPHSKLTFEVMNQGTYHLAPSVSILTDAPSNDFLTVTTKYHELRPTISMLGYCATYTDYDALNASQ